MFLHVFISFHDFQGCLNVFQCFLQCCSMCFHVFHVFYVFKCFLMSSHVCLMFFYVRSMFFGVCFMFSMFFNVLS